MPASKLRANRTLMLMMLGVSFAAAVGAGVYLVRLSALQGDAATRVVLIK